jgi:Na+/melibiose symporter-like transporter
MRELFRRRDARLLLAGQTVSLFGDTAMFLVLGIWVKDLTGSTAAAGLVFFVFGLPGLFAPLFGWVVDRLPRRRLLMAEHGALAVILLSLLFVQDEGDVWLIYVVAALYGVGSNIGQPSRAGLLKVMLPDELLGDANAWLATANQGLRLVSPLAGAGLYAVAGGGVVAIVDASTFLVSVATLALLKVNEPPPQPREHRFLREVSEGARHIWVTLPLRQVVVAVAGALVVIGFAETAIFAVVDEGLNRPPAFLGVLEVFQGLGAILGGVTAASLMRRIGDGTLAGIGLIVFGIGDALWVFESLPVVIVGFTIAGVGIPWAIVGFSTALQRRSPAHVQGRVNATASMIAIVPQTFSIGLGAALVTVVDYRLLLLIMGSVTAACGLYLITRRTFAAPASVVEPAVP